MDGKRETLYVDGCLNAQHEVTLSIGSGQRPSQGSAAGERFFSGALSDVRIYDRALDGQEIQDLYAQGSGSMLTEWRQNLEHVQMLLERGDNEAAATHLGEIIDECRRWIDANPRKASSSHGTLLHDACRRLAQLKLAADASDMEVADLMVRSGLASLDAVQSVETSLWLNAHVCSAQVARVMPLLLPAAANRFDRVEAVTEQLEITGNWNAFRGFLDAVSIDREDMLPLGRAVVASLRDNDRWLVACHAYCRDCAPWRDVACELAELLAWRSAVQRRFGDAAAFYRECMTRSESSARRSTYALRAGECLLKDGQYEQALTLLDALADGTSPYRVRAALWRARAQMQLRRFDAASQTLRAIPPEDATGDTASEILFLDGSCRLACKDLAGAAAVFRTLLREAPQDRYTSRARLLLQYCCANDQGPALAAK